MDARVDSDGSALPVLPSGLGLLHPEDSMFVAMLEGWARQQRGGRRLGIATIEGRASVIRQFADACGKFPWQWGSSDVDEWTTHLVAVKKLADSTIRVYQGALRQFCDYITSPFYDWPAQCEKRFGTHPVQVCHEWNTTAHLVDYEGRPDRRPMTRPELQQLFDYADERVDQAMKSGRKGALGCYRDATVLKVIYGWGLRCNEVSMLDLTDFYRNPKAPELGPMGAVHVRYGKASKGSPPKRRTVLSVMPWAVEAVRDYVENARPLYHPRVPAILWPTERGNRLRTREIQDRFAEYRDALGLDQALTQHCLRHSYVTHLIENGADAKFVQEQVGHVSASTTAIYTSVSGDFMNSMLRKVLDDSISRETLTTGKAQ